MATKAKAAVIVFPGSNCDRDTHHILSEVLGLDTTEHWYKEPLKKDYGMVVLPGGFSYGDYLRAGALARIAPAVADLEEFIDRGKIVLGICNGFQILVEAGYLPGALMKNRSLRFQCQDVWVRVESTRSKFLDRCKLGQVLRMPIAHAEGSYRISEKELKRLEANSQIALRYVGPNGELEDRFNANGSVSSIAGLTNEAGNVMGLMPHPERCSEEILGNSDGLFLFRSLLSHL